MALQRDRRFVRQILAELQRRQVLNYLLNKFIH
jgi:hypothetical protein